MSVTINDHEVMAMFKYAIERFGGNQLQNVIGQTMLSDIKIGFRLGIAPDGKKWQPLKKRQGQILVDTGILRSSFTKEIDNHSVTVGTNIRYAPTHQFGSKKRNIPARPFIGFEQRQRKKLFNVINNFIKDAF